MDDLIPPFFFYYSHRLHFFYHFPLFPHHLLLLRHNVFSPATRLLFRPGNQISHLFPISSLLLRLAPSIRPFFTSSAICTPLTPCTHSVRCCSRFQAAAVEGRSRHQSTFLQLSVKVHYWLMECAHGARPPRVRAWWKTQSNSHKLNPYFFYKETHHQRGGIQFFTVNKMKKFI